MKQIFRRVLQTRKIEHIPINLQQVAWVLDSEDGVVEDHTTGEDGVCCLEKP